MGSLRKLDQRKHGTPAIKSQKLIGRNRSVRRKCLLAISSNRPSSDSGCLRFSDAAFLAIIRRPLLALFSADTFIQIDEITNTVPRKIHLIGTKYFMELATSLNTKNWRFEDILILPSPLLDQMPQLWQNEFLHRQTHGCRRTRHRQHDGLANQAAAGAA